MKLKIPYKIKLRKMKRYKGLFTYGNYKSEEPHITLNRNCNVRNQLMTFLHENIHARHWQRSCKCYKYNSSVEEEYHALRGTLALLLRKKCKNLLKLKMSQIILLCNFDGYKKACAQVMLSKIWQKCESFLTSK